MWLDVNFVISQTKLNVITDKITYKSKINYFDRGKVILIHRTVTKLNGTKVRELSAGTEDWDSKKSKTQMCYKLAVRKISLISLENNSFYKVAGILSTT